MKLNSTIMNAKILSIPKFILLEKRYLASRVICLIFIVTIFIDLVNGQNSASSTNGTFVSLGFLSLFIVQFIFQFKYLNWFLGIILFLASIYFSLAVLSEFSDFPVPNKDAYILLLVGLSLCIAGIISSVFVLRSLMQQ